MHFDSKKCHFLCLTGNLFHLPRDNFQEVTTSVNYIKKIRIIIYGGTAIMCIRILICDILLTRITKMISSIDTILEILTLTSLRYRYLFSFTLLSDSSKGEHYDYIAVTDTMKAEIDWIRRNRNTSYRKLCDTLTSAV